MKDPQELNANIANDSAISANDFVSHLPSHRYIFIPTGGSWPAASVDSILPKISKMRPSQWLDRHRCVHQMTWIPGEPTLIHDRLIASGGVIERVDSMTLNLYRPPLIEPGQTDQAQPWLNHIMKIYPNDHAHIVNWLAQRVQTPWDKINHALVLGRAQGIGKDTLLEPVRYAVGPWNFEEVSPISLTGRFNGFAKSVILRISEARDLGEGNRFTFCDHCKIYCSSPPEVLRVDEKHLPEYPVFNCTGLVITTNYRTDGVYLPPDDRRHYGAWSPCVKEDFAESYWIDLHHWYLNGGNQHVAAFLMKKDISDFDPKAPPQKTATFWDIAQANRAPEDAELADLLDDLDSPAATTLASLITHATGDALSWLSDRKNRRVIPHRMETCDYLPVRNPFAKDGLWKISGKRRAVYARNGLSESERFKAAHKLTDQ
jgi:hypothetical protein